MLSRPSSTFLDLARYEAEGGFYVEIEGLSSRELFLISVLTISNVVA